MPVHRTVLSSRLRMPAVLPLLLVLLSVAPLAARPVLEPEAVHAEVAWLRGAFFRTTEYRDPANVRTDCSAAGAYGTYNRAYEKTGRGTWYIEEQRRGTDAVLAGICRDNDAAVERGMRILRWGFRQQRADGGFDCPDVFHSASFFLEASSYAYLLVLHSRYSNTYWREIGERRPRITALARWLSRPELEKKGRAKNKPFAHRWYLVAAAFGQAGMLTGDWALVDKAAGYARDGIAVQHADGWNPEQGGWDTSYHAVGLVFVGRYYRLVADVAGKRALKPMLRRATDWLAGRTRLDGTVDMTGNTRTGPGSKMGRNAKPKTLNWSAVVVAFHGWAGIGRDASFTALARRVYGAYARN